MKKALLTFLCAVATVANSQQLTANTQRHLHDGWRFRQGNSEIWHPAQVPGNTHLDLMRERIIDDPFFRLNERAVQWVDKEDWMYETHFSPTAKELAATNQTLVFKGLDTYADVYLNHQRILVADNMHRTWRCDVRGIMKEGDNLLEVYFKSPIKINVPKFDALPYRHNTGPDHSQMGGLFDKTISPFARTAGYEYGWDWGPRLVTFGIWRPVVLETWSGTRLADVWYIQKDVNKSRAQLQTIVEIETDAPVASATVNITADGKQAATKTVSLVKGLNTVAIDYTLRNPRLWWTNGLGMPYLTQMLTTLTIGPVCCDSVATPLGIRSLKLHNEKESGIANPLQRGESGIANSLQRNPLQRWDDTHKPGHCLYFELNGEPLYAKGSNMVPNDNFLTRCNDSVYHRVVSDAAAVNMNIIRVWGGGIYEDDAFYRYCDEMGILVWQDFMFACQTYEVDSAFLATVKAEAIDNVRRLRNHACMAVYTGNNEEQDVWFGWGGKKRYFEERGQAERVWAMQRSIFYEVLPDVVRQYGGGTAYRPSSPWAFDDTPSDGINGDDHYWGVWHGGEPFEAYFDHHVRFQSEYGFQSFPEYESVLRYNPDPRDHNIYSEVMMAHQNAGTYANHRIEEYMGRDYHVPADFPLFLYVGQVLQADGVKMGMEAFRRDRPYCMGGIIWQLNDCWPVASWSSRDYYGRWKALHYVTRKAYDDILVSPRVKDEKAQARQNVQVAALPGQEDVGVKQSEDIALSRKVLELKLVNDRRSSVRGTLTLQTLTLDGRVVCQKKQPLTLPKNDAIDVYTLPLTDLLRGEQPENVIFYITYETAGKTYYNIAYPLRQKQMAFRKPHLSVTLTPVADGFNVTVGTDVFARAVFLKTKGISDFFSDNYFDLLPGQSRTLHLRTNKPLEQIQQELETITLADTY
ncbi:MAG: glycoside hydrolase family 2 protein [Prevotella sp.]|nr:glycoside hydrolase family 2 protein [Prevotella sp.]